MACKMNWTQVQLNQIDCVSLQSILRAFDAPISEQYAWAIVYQALKCLEMILEATDISTEKFVVQNGSELLIHKEGYVHADTFLCGGANRKLHIKEEKTIAELGMVVYEALDYNIEKDKQRQLDPELEHLLELMVDVQSDAEDDNEGDDEGIEDCDESTEFTEIVLAYCRKQLALEDEADSHYSSVCRALVAEVLELSSFMEKIAQNNVCSDEDLMDLERKDWSNIWQQLMYELRNGIKLKKVNYSKTASEYELTPYEILMDDIRRKKWELTPVTMNPQVKHDARNIILDFIRSRPPLKPASERILPPRTRETTPVEQLMEDIRNKKARQSLRKTGDIKTKLTHKHNTEVVVKKKIIDLNEEDMKTLLNFELDDDTIDSPNSSLDASSPKSENIKQVKKLEAHSTKASHDLLNKHFHTNGFSELHLDKKKPTQPFCDKNKIPRKCINFKDSNLQPRKTPLEPSQLTLEEFCHIKAQLNKAKLGSMESEDSIKKNLEKGKLCFQCKKTYFGLFNWSAECHICKAKVCYKCLTRMNLPHGEMSDFPLRSLIFLVDGAKPDILQSTPRLDRRLTVCDLTEHRFGSSRASEGNLQFSQDKPTTPLPLKRAPFLSQLPARSTTSLCLKTGSALTSKTSELFPNSPILVRKTAPTSPVFKRSKTMSRAEGAARKNSILQQQALAIKSIPHEVCYDCKEGLVTAILMEAS